MKSFEIFGARYNADEDRIEIVKEITLIDNTTSINLHMFKPDVLEWRAAEYDIDDLGTLIDLIVHEPFIEGTEVYGDTKEAIRELHLSKINSVKTMRKENNRNKTTLKAELIIKGLDQRYVDAIDNDYQEIITNHCHFDIEMINVKKEYVAKERTLAQTKKLSTQNSRPSRNVDELRKQLFREDSKDSTIDQKDQTEKGTQENKHVQIFMRNGKIVKE